MGGLETRLLELDQADFGTPVLIGSLLAHLRGGFLRGIKELPKTLARDLAHRTLQLPSLSGLGQITQGGGFGLGPHSRSVRGPGLKTNLT